MNLSAATMLCEIKLIFQSPSDGNSRSNHKSVNTPQDDISTPSSDEQMTGPENEEQWYDLWEYDDKEDSLSFKEVIFPIFIHPIWKNQLIFAILS